MMIATSSPIYSFAQIGDYHAHCILPLGVDLSLRLVRYQSQYRRHLTSVFSRNQQPF